MLEIGRGHVQVAVAGRRGAGQVVADAGHQAHLDACIAGRLEDQVGVLERAVQGEGRVEGALDHRGALETDVRRVEGAAGDRLEEELRVQAEVPGQGE